MKPILAFLFCAVCPMLLAEPAPNLNAPAAPTGPSIDITEGYGAAKWGMSLPDFEKLYPEAKMEGEVAEDTWTQQSGRKTYALGNESLKLQFQFLRGKLVSVLLTTTAKNPPRYGSVARNLKSMEQRIADHFEMGKDSGVNIQVQFPYRNFIPSPVMVASPPPPPPPQLGGAPGRANGAAPPAAVPAQAAPVRRPLTPGPGMPVTTINPQRPQVSDASTVTIFIEQAKLVESIEQEFTSEIAAAQNKLAEELITKLAPPK